MVLRKGKKVLGNLRIKTTSSDIKELAELALNKLIFDEALRNMRSAVGSRSIDNYVEQGKEIIQSDYSRSLLSAMSKTEPFVELIDRIAEVRKSCCASFLYH